MSTLEEENAAYLAAKADPVVGPILDAFHTQDARTYHGRSGDIVALAQRTAKKVEAAIRADERRRIADVLDNHLTTFVGFAKDIAFTLRLKGDTNDGEKGAVTE